MKEELIKYVMGKADKEYSDDFPIHKIKEWIQEFFNQYQPERSKRENHCPDCKNILIPNEGSLWCKSCDWRGWIYKDSGCGALNIVETQ